MVKEIWKMVVKGVFVGIVYPVANTLVAAIPVSQLKMTLWNWFGTTITPAYLIAITGSVWIATWVVKKYIFKG